MDLLDMKDKVDMIVRGINHSKDDEGFVEAIKPVLPALIRGQPSAYMSAVQLVCLAQEMVLRLYSADDFLDFGKYLEKSAESVKRCAMTSNLSNGNTPPRSND